MSPSAFLASFSGPESTLSSLRALLRHSLVGEQVDSKGLVMEKPKQVIYDPVMPTQSPEKLLDPGLIELLHGAECLLQTLQAQQ